MHDHHASLAQQHDLTLLGLALLICCIGIVASFALGREALQTPDPSMRRIWTAGGVVATASTIWAAHFVSMLAFEPGVPFGLDVARTILSYVLALIMVAAGATVIMTWAGVRSRLAGGALIGLAISAMHYTGMSAYQFQGVLRWDGTLLAWSILSGMGLSMLGALASSSRFRWLVAAGPLCLLAAIAFGHVLGMAAMTIEADPALPMPATGVNRAALVILVSNVVLVLVALSLAALWLATRDRRRLAAEGDRLRELTDIAVEGLLLCEDEIVVSVNQSLERTMNCTAADVVGRRLGDILPGVVAREVSTTEEVDAAFVCSTAEQIPVRIIGRHITFGTRTLVAVATRDQRERLRSDSLLRQLAHHDALTGLANRLSFAEALEACLTRSLRRGETFALLMLDLDRFKVVNDTMGHAMGDELLRSVALRLQQAIGPEDVVARLGGDEFAILVNLSADLSRDRSVAEVVIDLLSRPFPIEGHVIHIAASIGIALAPQDGREPSHLMRGADLALYRSKQDGGCTYRYFEPEMSNRVQARRMLELDLRRAAAEGEFELVYQPQVDARSGAFSGAEALIRWRHPLRGLVQPGDFIPLAEEIGLIGTIGEWLLHTACIEAMRWPDHMVLAVNLSPVQVRDPQLAASVAAILTTTGLPGSRLELEVTETALLQDDGSIKSTLQALRDMGISIALDDFGTGYSSLSHLRLFPVDKIKIDQSFIRQVPHDADSVAIVQAIVSLGAKLGLDVTVEGVETAEQYAFAVAQGCDQVQGYLISWPVTAPQLNELFAATGPTRAVA